MRWIIRMRRMSTASPPHLSPHVSCWWGMFQPHPPHLDVLFYQRGTERREDAEAETNRWRQMVRVVVGLGWGVARLLRSVAGLLRPRCALVAKLLRSVALVLRAVARCKSLVFNAAVLFRGEMSPKTSTKTEETERQNCRVVCGARSFVLLCQRATVVGRTTVFSTDVHKTSLVSILRGS